MTLPAATHRQVQMKAYDRGALYVKQQGRTMKMHKQEKRMNCGVLGT